jgi:hypothetical protein
MGIVQTLQTRKQVVHIISGMRFIHVILFCFSIVKSGERNAFRFMVNRELVISVPALWTDLKTCGENPWIDRPLAKVEISVNIDTAIY